MKTVKQFIDNKVIDSLFTQGGTLGSMYISMIINDNPIFSGIDTSINKIDMSHNYKIKTDTSIHYVNKKQYDAIQECYIYMLYVTNPNKHLKSQAEILGWI